MNQWISDRDHGEKEKKKFVGTECRRAENVDLKCLGSPLHKNRGLENLFWARTRNLCQGSGFNFASQIGKEVHFTSI